MSSNQELTPEEIIKRIANGNNIDPSMRQSARTIVEMQKYVCNVPYMLANVEGTCNIDSLFFGFCYPSSIRRVLLDKLQKFAAAINSRGEPSEAVKELRAQIETHTQKISTNESSIASIETERDATKTEYEQLLLPSSNTRIETYDLQTFDKIDAAHEMKLSQLKYANEGLKQKKSKLQERLTTQSQRDSLQTFTEDQKTYIPMLLHDFTQASELFKSNAHTMRCPTFKLELDMANNKYANHNFDTILKFHSHIFTLLKIPFITEQFAAKTNFTEQLQKLAKNGEELIAVKLKVLQNIFTGVEGGGTGAGPPNGNMFEFESFYDCCKSYDYYTRTFLITVRGDNGRPGHTMAYSSCTEVHDNGWGILRDTHWLFYDAQGMQMYMQGTYSGTIEPMFKVQNNGICISYNDKKIFNDDFIVVLVRGEKAGELLKNERAEAPSVSPPVLINSENDIKKIDLVRKMLYVLP